MQEVFKARKIKREEVFIATKLWNNNHRPERVKPAFEASLKKLQLDYVDLYLIHTPFAFQPGDEQDPRDANGNVIYDKGVTLLDTWRALEGLVDEGKCKAIGLSDVGLAQMKEIFEAAGSSRQLFTSNPIRISRNGTFWTIAKIMASCCKRSQRWGTAASPIAGRSCRHRNRQASQQDPGSGLARLGHPARNGPPDHLEDPQPDQGEF